MAKNFRDFYDALTASEREVLAASAETHPGYLWQLAHGDRHGKAGARIIEKLMSADKRITFQMMRSKAA